MPLTDANDIEFNTLADGACVDYPDPDIFIVEPYQRPTSAVSRLAKLICNSCVVVDLCLQEADELNDNDSIRGGLLPSERRKLKGLRR